MQRRSRKFLYPFTVIGCILLFALLGVFSVNPSVVAATPEDFHIYTERDYLSLMSYIGGSGDYYANRTVYLHTDLYLDRLDQPKAGKRFEGVFEGNGHAIVGLKENAPAVNGQPVAWLSVVGMNAEIRNLDFIDANIVAGDDTTGQGAAVAGILLGKLTNVRVHGTVEADEGGGLVHTNYGTITNCQSFVTSRGDFGALAYLNDEISVNDGDGTDYEFHGRITESYGSGNAVYENKSVYVPAEYANGRLEEEKTVKHWFDLYALTHGAFEGEFAQASDLNYYNTHAFSTEAWAFPAGITYDNAGFVWYHASRFTDGDSLSIGEGTVSFPTVTGADNVDWTGEGTKTNPYRIGTAEELAAYMTGNYIALTSEDRTVTQPTTYFMLTENIVGDFSEISERKARQNTVLEGENHSILTLGTLFTEIEETTSRTDREVAETDLNGNPIRYREFTVVENGAEIYRLTVRATEGENGVFAETMGGRGEYLNFYGDGGAAGIAKTVTGTLRNFHAEAEGEYAVAAEIVERASVQYGRSMTDNAVAGSTFGTVQYVYAEGDLPKNAQNSVGRTEDGYTVDFTSILKKDSEKSGWEFGTQWTFAALKGQAENEVRMPFPADRASYKTIDSHTFGQFATEVTFYISQPTQQRMSIYFRDAETGTLLGTDRGVSVYKENAEYYLKGTESEVALTSLDRILRDICGNGSSIVWRERLSLGWERVTTDFNRRLGTATFVARVETGRVLTYAEFALKEWDTNPYFSVLIKNYRLNTPDLTEIANRFVGDSEGITVEWSYFGNPYYGDSAVGLGDYVLTVTSPTTEIVAGWTEVRTLRFSQGANPMDDKDVFGSFPAQIFVPYDGTEFNLAEILPDCAFVGQLNYRITTQGAVVAKNAGAYRVEITLENSRFLSPNAPKSVTLTITRKALTVTPVVAQVVYGEALQVTYTWADNALAAGDILSESEMRNRLDYTTDYTVGSKVGTYYLQVPNGTFGNYSVTGERVTFSVTPAPLPAPDLALAGGEVNYDGQYHAPRLSGVPNGATLSYIVRKGTEWLPYSASGYIDAGSYSYTLTVSMGTNYETLVYEAALTIKQIVYNVEATHADVPYGQSADSWQISVPEIPERADGKVDNIGTASVDCSYRVGNEVGNYEATPKGYVGNANFRFIYVSTQLHVVQADLEIGLENPTKGYDGTSYAPQWSVCVTEGQITYADSNRASLPNAPTALGSYYITLSLSESKNYKAFSREYSFSIEKGVIGETRWVWTNGNTGNEFVYDGTRRVLSLQGMPTGVSVSYSWRENGTVRGSNSGITVKNVAEITEITANLRGTNYLDAQRYYASVRVTPAPIRVLTPPKATFNGRAQTPRLQLTSDSKTYEEITVSAMNADMVHAGIYPLELTVSSPNYEIKNTETLNFEILSVEVNLSLGEPIHATYGNSYDRFVRETTVMLDGMPYSVNVIYFVGQSETSGAMLARGTYDIFSRPRAQTAADAEDISFILADGKGKYVVEPATVDFDWDYVLEREYVYGGETFFEAGEAINIPESEVMGKPVNNAARITVTFEKEVKNAGDYVAVAHVGNENYQLKTDRQEFTVKKRAAKISAQSVAIAYLSEGPDLRQQVILTGVVEGEKLNYVVRTDYRKGADVGTYPIEVTLLENPNYVLSAENGTLTVAKIAMGQITVPNEFTVDYTGMPPALPPLTGAPNGTAFTYDGDYTHAGVYENVKINAVHKNYWDKSVTLPKLIVRKACPTVTGTESTVRYRDGLIMNSELVNVAVTYLGQPVAGRMEIKGEGTSIVPGVNRFDAEFIPESGGDYEGKTFPLTVTAEIPKTEIQLDVPGLREGRITATERLVFRWTLPDDISQQVFTYLNGIFIGDAVRAVIQESVENGLLELRCKGSVIYSTYITVVIEAPKPVTPEPPTPPEPTAPEDPPQEIKQPKSNRGLIIGLSVAAGVLAVGIAAAAVVLVLGKKKKNREGEKS